MFTTNTPLASVDSFVTWALNNNSASVRSTSPIGALGSGRYKPELSSLDNCCWPKNIAPVYVLLGKAPFYICGTDVSAASFIVLPSAATSDITLRLGKDAAGTVYVIIWPGLNTSNVLPGHVTVPLVAIWTGSVLSNPTGNTLNNFFLA